MNAQAHLAAQAHLTGGAGRAHVGHSAIIAAAAQAFAMTYDMSTWPTTTLFYVMATHEHTWLVGLAGRMYATTPFSLKRPRRGPSKNAPISAAPPPARETKMQHHSMSLLAQTAASLKWQQGTCRPSPFGHLHIAGKIDLPQNP